MPLIDRIFEKLEWRGDCLVWTASLNDGGYGQVGEYVDKKIYNRRVHRVVYAETIGEIPTDTMVLHWCDNRACANPEHLHLGDNAMNLQECVARGRHPNRRKTHCPRNHPFDEVNTYVNPKGRRECRTCRTEKKKAARAAGATW